jgi:multicomponent Na+:H+ antiporter subunit E
MLGLLSVFAASWLLWSGLYKPLLLGLGVFSCLLSLYLAKRISYFDRDVFSFHLWPRLPRYWGWLLKEIVKSSIDVARIVLNPRLPIDPVVVKLDAEPGGPIGQAILGNSITLTPGTVTLDIADNQLTVHCLTRQGADLLLAGEMNRRAAALTED